MTIEKKENGKEITLLPVGKLDTTMAFQLEEQILDEISEGAEKLILDFQELESLSSTGLRVLSSAHSFFMRRGSGELIIRHVNENVQEVFEDAGFMDIFTIE